MVLLFWIVQPTVEGSESIVLLKERERERKRASAHYAENIVLGPFHFIFIFFFINVMDLFTLSILRQCMATFLMTVNMKAEYLAFFEECRPKK